MEKLMEMLIDNIPCWIWMKDKSGKFLLVNKFFADQCGYTKEYIINKYSWDIFNKEDSYAYKEREELAIKENREMVFRSVTNERVKEVFIKPINDENGLIIGTCGFVHDITAKIAYENEIVTEKNLLRTLFDNIPDAIFYKDENSKYLGCNIMCSKEFMQKEVEDLVGKDDVEIYGDEEQYRKFIEKDKEIMKTRKTVRTEATFIVSDGGTRHMESIKAPIFNNEKKVIGLVGISRDITERKKIEERLRELSYKDNLTGLYNRNYFEKAVIELDNNDSTLPLSIIMGDINGLKIVNDSLGHLEGDKFIVKISEVIKNSVPHNVDIVRWGGDEVVILLPNTTEEEADKLAGQIVQACIDANYEPIPLSISLGISTRTMKDKDIDTMLKEAEDKLYRQKLIQGKGIRGLIIDSLKKTLEEKSVETDKHTTRIYEHSIKLGKELKLSASKLDELVLVSKLHDIGKIGISEEILIKKDDLTEEEVEIMKSHVEKGFRIASASPDLRHVAREILTHHENWNGSGYPLGLKGEDIPLIARIIRVVDAYDSMINKDKLDKDSAVKKLENQSNKKFDKNIVDKFIGILKRMEK